VPHYLLLITLLHFTLLLFDVAVERRLVLWALLTNGGCTYVGEGGLAGYI